MTWWIWILVGLALLAVEIAIPGGIIMLFFGVSAMIVGVLVALGVGGPLWFQVLLFSVLSVVSLLTLRGTILRRMAEERNLSVLELNEIAKTDWRTTWRSAHRLPALSYRTRHERTALPSIPSSRCRSAHNQPIVHHRLAQIHTGWHRGHSQIHRAS